MDIKARPPAIPGKKSCIDDKDKYEEIEMPIRDKKNGVDYWISLSIKGKRHEVIKQQVAEHISRMKVRKFDFKA